jgi:hypothetical protein
MTLRTVTSALVVCGWLLAGDLAAGQVAVTKNPPEHSDKAAMFKQDMRKLWTDHVVWTRDYIVAAVADAPDAPAALNRLMKNQEQIGDAVGGFYGNPAGRQLTTLLKEHIAVAGDLVKAAKAGDKAGQQAADAKWRQNATQIASFLSNANPHLPQPALVELMNKHLSTTTDEVVARLNKKWDDDVKAFDAVYDHVLHMSDALAEGIVKQFPDKFGGGVAGTSGKR